MRTIFCIGCMKVSIQVWDGESDTLKKENWLKPLLNLTKLKQLERQSPC